MYSKQIGMLTKHHILEIIVMLIIVRKERRLDEVVRAFEVRISTRVENNPSKLNHIIPKQSAKKT